MKSCYVEYYIGDVAQDDSQQRFLAQHSVATLSLRCAKNRRGESSRVKSPS